METAELDVRIAQRIAAHEGVDAAALNPPLYDVVDVDALEKLINSQPHEQTEFIGVVSFDYCGNTVTVDHTGAVSVTSLTAEDHDSDPTNSDESPNHRVVCEPQ